MLQSGVNISIRWHGSLQNPATYVKPQIWHCEECICCTSDNISLSYSLVSSIRCWFCHFFSDSSENRRFLRTPPWKHYEPVAPRTQHASTAALCRKPALQELCWRRTVWHTDHVSVNKMQLGLFVMLWLGRDCCVTSGSVLVQKDEVSPWWQEVTSPAPFEPPRPDGGFLSVSAVQTRGQVLTHLENISVGAAPNPVD